MAIGRISGPMLYSNLERQGVDLAIEGNLIYADVTQLRVGINTNTPNAELHVVGQSHLGNIVVSGNVISSTTGHVNLGSTANVVITGGANDYVLVTDGAGNLRWDEISNLDQTWGNLFFSDNQISITQLNGNLELAANGSGYVVALNNLYAPNVIAGNVNAVYFNGNIRSAEIVAAGNITAPNVESTFYGNLFGDVVGTNGTFTGNVAADYFNGNVRSNNIIATGNVAAQYFVGDLSGNIVGALQGNVTGNISGSNAVFTGNISANWFNGNITGINSNFTTANAAAFYGNVFAQAVISPVGDLHLGAATNNPNNIIRFDSVSAFDIPSGTTAQRPPTPDYGYVRYNTDLGTIEWWGGSTWVPGSNLIVSENITPDGVNAVYTLGQTTTENAILVNINGTIQQAGAGAYSVAGNQITFAETPLVTDIIEIRYIAGGVAALTVNFANIAGNVSPSANVTYDLGSPNYRWRDLWLSGNTINLGSASLSAVGNTIQLPAGSTVGGANVDVTGINSNIAAVNANVAAANAAIITANTAMKNYVDEGLADALFVAGSYGNVTVAAYLPSDQTILSIRNGANAGNANVGAYQIWANTRISSLELVTNSNLANAVSNTNSNITALQSNINSYQTFANASVSSFYAYANTKIGTNNNSNLVVVSTTDSTSSTTGALVVRGGAGVAGNIYVQGIVDTNQLVLAGQHSLQSSSSNELSWRTAASSSLGAYFSAVGSNNTFINSIEFTTQSIKIIAANTVATSNVTGALVVGGGLGVSGRIFANGGAVLGQPGTTSNVVIASTTTSSSQTTGALVVRGGLGVIGTVNASSVDASSVNGTGAYFVAGNFQEVFTSNFHRYTGETATLAATDTTYDINLSQYIFGGSSSYTTVTIEVQGLYINDTTSPTPTYSRFFKVFAAGIWYNDTTGNYTVEGAVLDYSFNTDATNFPAGAVGAGKAFITGSGTPTVSLRLTNRTSPAVNSITYFSIVFRVHSW